MNRLPHPGSCESVLGSDIADAQDRRKIALEHVEPLRGSEGKHPANKREVDTVCAVCLISAVGSGAIPDSA